MTATPKRRLGRGLAALIGDDANEETVVQDARGLRHVPIEFIYPNAGNPRKNFKDDELRELAQSLREKGLLQPLVVRPRHDETTFEIVAGERRWRAAQMAGLHELPVLIRELSDAETLEIALIENIQRADLNPLEEARGYGQLIEMFDYTQQQLADSVGKSRSHIANTLRLMTLPAAVIEHVEAGRLSAGHARALIATDGAETLADKIIRQGLSVRETENLVRRTSREPQSGSSSSKTQPVQKSADVRALEKALEESLGLTVDIEQGEGEAGAVRIAYKTLEQLEMVCAALRRVR